MTAKRRAGGTRRRRPAKSGASKAKVTLTAPTKSAVTAIVNQQIMKAAETKYVSDYAANTTPNTYTTINSGISGATQWAYALPSLLGGTDTGSPYTRQGGVIMPRQVKVALDVRLLNTSLPHDITVVVYYGYCKTYTKYADVVTNSSDLCDQLLRLGGKTAGGAETQSFNGIQSDSHLLINTDVWHLRKETFRLNKAPGVLNGSGGAGVLSQGNKNNHSMLLDFSKMCPAKLKFDTTTDDEPSNWSPVFSIGYYYNDATAPDTGLSGIIAYQAIRHLTFKDF